LSRDELSALAARISVRHIKPKEILFGEGERGGDLLIVQSGRVRVFKAAVNGRQQLLSIERAGSTLGEVSVFDGGSYSATAIADSPVVALRLSGIDFQTLCATSPDVALKVIRVLGHRLRLLRALVEQLSFSTVRDRLISYLLRLAEEHGSTDFPLTENNEQLADRLGTVRELVSRNLGRLHSEGLIRMRRKAVTIPDISLLRAALNG
jgi:CRP-like cAMP-binding protein